MILYEAFPSEKISTVSDISEVIVTREYNSRRVCFCLVRFISRRTACAGQIHYWFPWQRHLICVFYCGGFILFKDWQTSILSRRETDGPCLMESDCSVSPAAAWHWRTTHRRSTHVWAASTWLTEGQSNSVSIHFLDLLFCDICGNFSEQYPVSVSFVCHLCLVSLPFVLCPGDL